MLMILRDAEVVQELFRWHFGYISSVVVGFGSCGCESCLTARLLLRVAGRRWHYRAIHLEGRGTA